MLMPRLLTVSGSVWLVDVMRCGLDAVCGFEWIVSGEFWHFGNDTVRKKRENDSIISYNLHWAPQFLHSKAKGLFPYYIISYNKQGLFQMIIEDYNKGPRVVRKDYVL